jgi:polyisoprenoid-binding protein YceI
MLVRILAFCLLVAAPAGAAPWVIDPATTVSVDVGWQGRIIEVRFPSISGNIDFDEANPEQARATIVVGTRDATTGAAPVNALVRSAGYLDVDRFPEITFALDKLDQASKTTATIKGRITLRGITRPASFTAKVTAYGALPDDPGRFRAGFDLTGEIDRTAFGSTAGVPDVAAVLPVHIHLLMTSR